MAGPCTLLAQPHYNRYIDAAGTHDMHWVSGVSGAHLQLGVETDDNRLWDYEAPPAALSAFVGLGAPWEAYIQPAGLISFGDNLSSLTVVNGTKSKATTGTAEFAALGMHDAFRANARMSMFGSAFVNQFPLLTATGANLTATRVTLAGTPSGGNTATIVVGNCASAPRTFQLVRAGVDIGAPVVVPAKTIAMLSTGSANASGWEASQAVGFRVVDSVDGEQYLAPYIGLNNYNSSPAVVPSLAASISMTLELGDLSGEGPIVPWAGGVGTSIAMEGERYWRVAVDRTHFPGPVEGEIVSRWLPVGWPAHECAAAFGLSRTGEYAYNATTGFHSCYFGAFINRNMPNHGPLNWQFEWMEGPIGFPRDNVPALGWNRTPDVVIPTPDVPWDAFMVTAVTWNANRVSVFHDGSQIIDVKRQTTERDFPFFGVEPTEEGTDDAVYLGAFDPVWWWNRSRTFHRDVAVFSRNLTDAEHAFLNDDDGIWTYNMFAEPVSATVTGLDTPIYRGDDRTVTVQVLDADGEPVPLYGHTVWFTGKTINHLRDDHDADALITSAVSIAPSGSISTEQDYVDSDPRYGTVSFQIAVPFIAANHLGDALLASTTTPIQWDVQVQDVNGVIRTLAIGQANISVDVTRRETVA